MKAAVVITAIEIKADERGIEFGRRRDYPIPEANLNRGFAVSRDGQRFLVSLNGVAQGPGNASPKKFTIVTNWTELLP